MPVGLHILADRERGFSLNAIGENMQIAGGLQSVIVFFKQAELPCEWILS